MLALFLPKQGPKRAIFKHFTFFFSKLQHYSIKMGGGAGTLKYEILTEFNRLEMDITYYIL